ncbi:hypothetical protein [Streptomyces sp. MNP-20]|uniref:hypothetical protein n=1 Tax=Streptomyces sp. MNP-20 TaxID=2721165 RepID=UPI0015567FE8|nr:hypothetical protein [Streptomyces sp. MNP-20]
MPMPLDGTSGVEDDYIIDFDFDGDWLGLTLHEGSREEARQVALSLSEQFNPLELKVGKAALQRELTQRALNLNEESPVLACAMYSVGGELLAEMVGNTYGEDGVPRPSPEEWRSQLLDWGEAKPKSAPVVSEIELPIGPALRISAVLEEKRRLGFGRRLSETLRYAVWPIGQAEIYVLDVDWLHFDRSDEVTHLADKLMSTIRLVPVPSDFDERNAAVRGEA